MPTLIFGFNKRKETEIADAKSISASRIEFKS